MHTRGSAAQRGQGARRRLAGVSHPHKQSPPRLQGTIGRYEYLREGGGGWMGSRENSSVNSELEGLKESKSTRQHTQATPPEEAAEMLFVYQLESKVLELQKIVDQQNFQIQSLTTEAELYMKMCEDQKDQLRSTNVEMLKQEFGEHQRTLEEEKRKISELIVALSEEYGAAEEEQEKVLRKARLENDVLSERIQEALNRKETLLRCISEEDVRCQDLRGIVAEQEDRLDQLRHIQRKWFIATQEATRQ